MKLLFINKYLYPKGGSETYMFQLAELLKANGYECEFWGMSDEKNIVCDTYNCFAENVDYSDLKGFQKISKLTDTVYSSDNRKKIQIILDQFKPDIVHIHNYNFQITPSILPEIKKRNIKIIHTTHDSQIVCPYHRMYNFQQNRVCTKCLNGNFIQCIINKCFNGSLPKSILGAIESCFYHFQNYYNKHIDIFISPSQFLANFLTPAIRKKIYVIPNFVKSKTIPEVSPGNFVLYFGRISEEKGIIDIQDSFISLRQKLLIIGDGPMKHKIKVSEYIEYLGPKYGDDLIKYIASARYVIQPSKWYENCPMTVIESYMCGTPVIVSNKGGFIEMVQNEYNGFLIDFDSNNYMDQLRNILLKNVEPLRGNCLKTYHEKYSSELHLKRISQIYNEILNSGL